MMQCANMASERRFLSTTIGHTALIQGLKPLSIRHRLGTSASLNVEVCQAVLTLVNLYVRMNTSVKGNLIV